MNKRQKQNAMMLLAELEKSTIVSPAIQVGILCVLMKECELIPRVEMSYANTSNDRIRKIFGEKKLGIYYNNDDALTTLKKTPREFFSVVYRSIAGNRGVASVDGWMYRGRGFPQHTGINNYIRASKWACVNLVKNPGLLRYAKHAAPAAVGFFVDGLAAYAKRYYNPDHIFVAHNNDIDWGDGILISAHINAGIGKNPKSKTVQRAYKNALKYKEQMRELYDEYWRDRMETAE